MEKINRSPTKPRLLVLSHVLPFPGNSGQQQRVLNTLRALQPVFHVTFLTFGTAAQKNEWQPQLAALCEAPVVLPTRTQRHLLARGWHATRSRLAAFSTGLKPSNYQIGQVEFAPARLQKWLAGQRFDLALYEYWHAAPSVAVLQAHGIPCVLDMHDILWQTYKRQLGDGSPLSPKDEQRLARYRAGEERAWQQYDALIAINHAEMRYVQTKVRPAQTVLHAPMGVDLSAWPYAWQPAHPPRLAYYGGLGSPHNQADALRCAREIMPLVWQQFPGTELWLVGSQPPEHLRVLAAQDRRIHVTGFVPDAAAVLKEMTAVLCPWQGTFGFRSRLIEAMAVGVPVIATPDAVYGMELQTGQGLWLGDSSAALAALALRFLHDPAFAKEQSRAARVQAETRFSLPATYGKLATELAEFVTRQTL